MSIKNIIEKFYTTHWGCGCTTLVITLILAVVAFNVTYNGIQKGDTISPDDGAGMMGLLMAFLVLAAGGCFAAVFFLLSVLHALKLWLQDRRGTNMKGDTNQENGAGNNAQKVMMFFWGRFEDDML